MTGEEALRRLADDLTRELASRPPGSRQAVRLHARPFLTGASIALFRAEAFVSPEPRQLLEELLAPIEKPLVDEGVIELVSFGFEEAVTGALAREEEPDR